MKQRPYGLPFLSLTASLMAFCSTGVAQAPVPGDARSAGLHYIVPDVALWFDNAGSGFITNGFINLSDQPNPVDLGNWEPYTSSMGESTFLIEFNTYANDGSFANQNNGVAIQPAAGGPGKMSYAYYDDTGKPFPGIINLSRQNGNPGRVAGDKRVGATNFITECETSLGQLLPFQSNNRWTSNNIYQGTTPGTGNRYVAEQIFSLNPATLAATPVTNAWDYVYGPYSGTMGADNGSPQCSRTGGRPDFLDNGNIVVMIDDKTGLLDPVNGEVSTFAIVAPNGKVVKGPIEAPLNPSGGNDIFDNMCAFAGGFCIRDHASHFFYDDDGNLMSSNNQAVAIANLQAAPPDGWGFTGAYDTGRGDADHIAGDIRSPYVFYADGVVVSGSGASASNAVMMAIWNGRTGAFITNVMVSPDLDPGSLSFDRVALAVNMSNQVCVAWDGQPDKTLGYANQTMAQVMQFDGANVTYLTPTFFAFINSDNTNTVAVNGLAEGYVTSNPSVSMTTKAICIAAKGTINSTNNPFGGPDSTFGSSSDYTTVYTVLSMPLGGPETAGSSYVVPDMALWWNTNKNIVTNGPVNIAQQGAVTSSDSWEPYASVVGASTFLIEFSTYANDGTLANMNNVIAKQPAAGGAPALGYAYYGDAGGSSPGPFMGQINLSRETGNPGRVAGDMRSGATAFITECEVSIGQLAPFKSDSRWTGNDIYAGTDRYVAEQLFTLDPTTLAQTPVTNAWDYVYGADTTPMGSGNNAPQCSRTGGRPVFLDNGNIAVVIDDKTEIVDPTHGEVTTFAVITPKGAIVSGPTEVRDADIWDNVCAFKGGFAVRVHELMYLYSDDGVLVTNIDVLASSGLVWGNDPSGAGGRGDAYRIGGSINSYYVYMAGGTTNVPGYSTAPMSFGLQSKDHDGIVYVAVWDTRTGACVATAPVCELDPAYYASSRAMIAVDAADDFTVAYKLRPTVNFPQFQTLARVGQLVGGTNIAWLGPSFYPFVNHDAYGNVFGTTNASGASTVYETDEPSVAMTTQQICISAKGTINSTNNPVAAPDTSPYTDLYTVIANPAAVAAARPTMTATLSAGNVIISWNASAGLFTLVSSSNLAAPLSSWAAVSPQPPATLANGKYSMTVPVKAGNQYFDLTK
jgi:hypothetical protein